MAESLHKRDFGSFAASNVQEILTMPEEDYIPPPIPIETPTFDKGAVEFGKSALEKHFFLENDFTFLNHGAFGAALKEVIQVSQRWQVFIERQPVRFIDRQLLPQLVHVVRRLAKFAGCPGTDIALMPNATTATNTIVRSLKLQAGDVVFMLSTEYGNNKTLIRHICAEKGAIVQEEEVTFPTSKQEILDLVSDKLQPDTKLALFDHIPSNTPFIVPIKELVEICHQRNVRVLVDGAHALGQLPLDIPSLGADYYVANAHKWLCAAKGTALMYCAPQHQRTTRPLVVSHGFGHGFSSEYAWQGLRDYSPWLALRTALDFWETGDPERIRHQIHGLAREAVELLCKRWGTEPLVEHDMYASMACVRLPDELYKDGESPVNYNMAETLQNLLHFDFSIEVPVKAIQGSLYVRISAHIYNVIGDYEAMATAVETIIKKQTLKRV